MTDNTIEKFTTSSGLPMEEYVPNNYPRSDVAYARTPFEKALMRSSAYHQPKKLVPLPEVEGAYVAGGYAADLLFNGGNGEPRDVDIFFNSAKAFEEMADRLFAAGFSLDSQCLPFYDHEAKKFIWTEEFTKQVPYVEFFPPFEKADAFGNMTVQLVKIRWYDSAEHVIDAFDFTVVQAAWDLGARECVFNPMGALHHAQRLIVQHRVESRARVSMRLQKYKDKGFSPTDAFVVPDIVEVTT